jgi:UDP-glucose 4-epimerase
MHKKILITGYRGFIGSYLCKHLNQNYQTIGLDIKDGVYGDAFHANKIPDVDVVCHLAAHTSVVKSGDYPALDLHTNALLTMHLLKMYKDSKFIYTGSGGASEQTTIISPYGLSKKIAGDYVRMLHPNSVVINLPNIYGKGGKGVVERFVDEPNLTIYGDGKQTRDYVYITDMVRCLALAMDWNPGIYFAGSGIPVSTNAIAKRFGKPVTYQPANKWELLDSCVDNTTPNWAPTTSLMEYIDAQFT